MSRVIAHRQGHRQRGFALLIVLWFLVLITFLITRLTATGSAEAAIARNLRRNAVQRQAVDGAVFEAAFHLRDSSRAHWAADGTPHTITRDDGAITVTITDEADKVNLNRAAPDLLTATLIAVGTDPARAAALAAAIVDWRATDPERPLPIKLAPYLAAGRVSGPPETPFREVEELGQVLGMDTVLLDRLRPHLTVFSTYGPTAHSNDTVAKAALQTLAISGNVPPDDRGYESVDVISVDAVGVARDGGRAARHTVLGFQKRTQGEVLRVLDWR